MREPILPKTCCQVLFGLLNMPQIGYSGVVQSHTCVQVQVILSQVKYKNNPIIKISCSILLKGHRAILLNVHGFSYSTGINYNYNSAKGITWAVTISTLISVIHFPSRTMSMHHRWANHRIVRAYITKVAGVNCYGGVSFGHGAM